MNAKISIGVPKVCSRCKDSKEQKEFRLRRKVQGEKVYVYRYSVCLECEAAIAKETKSSRKSQRKARAEVITAYGGKCQCCGEVRLEVLDIDHIKNNGGAARRKGETANLLYGRLRKQGFPKDEYQLLCRNCNWLKFLFGTCPHQSDVYSRFETGKVLDLGGLL